MERKGKEDLHWCCKWSISSSPRCNISLCWRAADCRILAPRTSIRHRMFCCKRSLGPIFPNLRGRQQAGHPCPRIACVCTTGNRRIFLLSPRSFPLIFSLFLPPSPSFSLRKIFWKFFFSNILAKSKGKICNFDSPRSRISKI